MSGCWGMHVRCEEVDMDEALQQLVSAGVMPEAAAQVRVCVMCVAVGCLSLLQWVVLYVGDKSSSSASSSVGHDFNIESEAESSQLPHVRGTKVQLHSHRGPGRDCAQTCNAPGSISE